MTVQPPAQSRQHAVYQVLWTLFAAALLLWVDLWLAGQYRWAQWMFPVGAVVLAAVAMKQSHLGWRAVGLAWNQSTYGLLLVFVLALVTLPIHFFAVSKLVAYAPCGPADPAHWICPTGRTLHLHWPSDLATWALLQLLTAALPEEVFYRGWVQSRLRQAYSPAVAIGVTAFVFALSHVVFQFHTLSDALRLLTFFPGLLFGWLRYRSGSIWPSVAFHWLCNMWVHCLQ